MDNKPITIETVIRFAKQRRVQTLTVGITMLVILAAFQVKQQSNEAHLCELYPNAKLSEGELYRLEFALIREGLEDFETNTEGKLLVPTNKRLDYIKAIARQNEEPIEYRKLENNGDATPSIFLPKSARDAMTLATKKKKIEKTILRLPYIVEANFEMDTTIGFSTFQKQQIRASISLATKDNLPLTGERVKTIKAIIQVAAGVDLENIVMIDLKTGLIHEVPHSPIDSNPTFIASDISETQRLCENRINEALAMYPNIETTVGVTIETSTANANLEPQVPKTKPLGVRSRNPSILQAGANSAVKIDTDAWSKSTIEVKKDFEQTPFSKVVSITIDVPEKLVSDRIKPPHTHSVPSNQSSLDADQEIFNTQFEQLKSEISKKVEATFSSTPDLASQDSIAFNLIPRTTLSPEPLEVRVKKIAAENWPSGIVLLVGLFLLVSISRSSKSHPTSEQYLGSNRQSSTVVGSDSDSSSDSEARLTQLIEKDPDAAARVIESWIRDAA
jgi:hypothetical protein